MNMLLSDPALWDVSDVNMTTCVSDKKRPGVGIGVFVTSKQHPGCIVLGKRTGTTTGQGMYALPGGHIEFGESWEDCAAREVFEETGLKIENVKYETVVNAVDLAKDYHYVTIFMKGEVNCDYQSEPENMEPDKCEGWNWIPWNKFPEPQQLFCALKVVRQQQYSPFST